MATLDSTLFDGSDIPEDTRAVAAAAKARIRDFPAWTAEHAKPIRAAKKAGTGGFPPIIRSPRAETIRIPGPAGEILLRVIASAAPQGVYLHIHGGGWYMGGADLQDHKLEALADDADLACVSVDYRLAPEHPYPAALEDCVAAASWLAENAPRLWGTGRLVIGGDSAGAHLAALTLVQLRDLAGTRFVCAHLIFGFFDLALTPGARQFGAERSTPRTADLRGFVDAFIGSDRDRRSPEISPLYADLSKLCPAVFVVGTEDALLEDSLFMHMRWLAAGNPSELHVYPGAPHNFVAMPCRAAADAHDKAIAFIRRHLAS
ncbi:alpha/beta hydrolase [Amycolatopsis pithecellobii]|uniref:alpha/beta hydrolase n=1 Tax=Amycolatopsis pithecellobii TaxID=664692 RepID=UPI00140A4B20|nr:alpha/beta hydrolase [Amycolatopsis pithecellobii]